MKLERRPKTSPEYHAWYAMIERCTDKDHASYHRYGGRGIAVCERWANSFHAFVEDMGLRPDPSLTLDRIDNNLGYEPGNCRWATRREQLDNREITILITHGEETRSITDWSERLGISYKTLKSRHRRGWSPERILAPSRAYRRAA